MVGIVFVTTGFVHIPDLSHSKSRRFRLRGPPVERSEPNEVETLFSKLSILVGHTQTIASKLVNVPLNGPGKKRQRRNDFFLYWALEAPKEAYYLTSLSGSNNTRIFWFLPDTADNPVIQNVRKLCHHIACYMWRVDEAKTYGVNHLGASHFSFTVSYMFPSIGLRRVASLLFSLAKKFFETHTKLFCGGMGSVV